MVTFSPWPALVGGVLIGLGAVLLLALNGRIAGVTGILGGLAFGPAGERGWRGCFLLGLGLGAWGAARVLGVSLLPSAGLASPWALALAGALVGYGTTLGGGCTSGHGVCGLGRLSLRSGVATGVFLAVAMLTTYLTRHVGGTP
jgi:uncharacterized protein